MLSTAGASPPHYSHRTLQGSGREHTDQVDADAVIVCNGHYSEPSLPAIPGMTDFPGRQMHTHNYRTNRAFAGLRVCVVGAQASGVDISQEIAQAAAQARPLLLYWPTINPGSFTWTRLWETA